MASREERVQTGKQSGKAGDKVVEKAKVSCLKIAKQHGGKDAAYKRASNREDANSYQIESRVIDTV